MVRDECRSGHRAPARVGSQIEAVRDPRYGNPWWRRAIQVVSVLPLLSGCLPVLSKQEASRLASAELARYCRGQGLSPATFRSTGVTAEGGCPWVFHYQSTRPRVEVVVYVQRNRQVELNALPGP